MFVFSIKTSKKQLVRLVGGAVLTAVALLLTAVLPGESRATAAHGRSTDERVTFLQTLGYDVSPTEQSVREMRIPDEWDEVFTAYNERQQEAGMDLQLYRGKRVKQYTYGVSNYPDRPQMQAHLLVYKGKIIGGDLTDTADPSFVTALVSHPAD